MVAYLGLLTLHRGSGGGLGPLTLYGDLVVVYLRLLTLHRGSGDGFFRTTYLT